MNLIVLQRLFDNAVSAYRNGNKHELDSFSDYIIRNPHARDDLMQSVKARWSDSAARGGAAGPGAVDADAFSTLLGIDSLWCDAASLFLSCLGEGCMSGRSVVLCIGQLSSKMHSICTATLDQAQLAEAIRFLCTVPDCCLSAILDDSCERSPDQSGLELIAPCMDALAVLCRRRQAAAFKEANPVGQAVGAMLDRSWGHHISALIHVMCDIHAHLGARHRDILKNKIASAAPSLPAEEFGAVILGCFRHFELSSDTGWIRAVRELYRCVPVRHEHSVEAVLEHSLQSLLHQRSFRTCLRAVQAVEDAAAAARSAGPTGDEFQAPLPVNASDVRLILLLMRACRSRFGDIGVEGGESVESVAMRSGAAFSEAEVGSERAMFVAQVSRTFCLLWLLCEYNRIRENSPSGMVDVIGQLLKGWSSDIINKVLGCPSSGTRPDGPDNGDGSSTSSRHRHGSSWTAAARAADVYFICSYCARDVRGLVIPCVQFILDRQLPHEGRLCENSLSMSTEMTQDMEKAAVTFLADCIAGCFVAVGECRSSLFTLIMRSIVDYGGGASGSIVATDDSAVASSACYRAVMIKSLWSICLTHGDLLRPLYPHFHSFIPMLTLLRIEELTGVFEPFLHVVLMDTAAGRSSRAGGDAADLRGSLLNVCRKCALQKEPGHSLFGIRALISLMPALSAAVQLEICQSIIFPTRSDHSQNESLMGGVDGYLPGHRFQQTIIADVAELLLAENNRITTAASVVGPDKEILYSGLTMESITFLRAALMQKLISKFVILDEDDNAFIRVRPAPSTCEVVRTATLRKDDVVGTVYFSPSSCCDDIKRGPNAAESTVRPSSKVNSGHIIRDDICLLLRVCWTIEVLLHPAEAVEQLEWLGNRILRGASEGTDSLTSVTQDLSFPGLWSEVIFKGIVHLVQDGFAVGMEHPAPKYHAVQDISCSQFCISDLNSKEHLLCIFGAVSALADCLVTTLKLVPNHNETEQAVTSLQAVLDVLVKLSDTGGDMSAFTGMANSLVSKMNGAEVAGRYVLRPAQGLRFMYKWGMYFSQFTHAKDPLDVLCPVSLVLSALKMSCFMLAAYVRCLHDLSLEPPELIRTLTAVFSLLQEVYDKLGGITVESKVKTHAAYLYSRWQQAEDILNIRSRQRMTVNRGINKRKKSIYTEYSDLSDFDDEGSIANGMDVISPAPGSWPDSQNSDRDRGYDGCYNDLAMEMDMSGDPIISLNKNHMSSTTHLVSVCLEEVYRRAGFKVFTKVDVMDLFVSLSSRRGRLARAGRRIPPVETYLSALHNSLFGMRFELLEAIVSMFSLYRTSTKTNAYSQLIALHGPAPFSSCPFHRRRDLELYLENVSKDLAIAVKSGTTFRLLKANLDLIKVIIDIRNSSSDPGKVTYTSVDNMLLVMCSCCNLVPRVIARIAGLAIDVSSSSLQLVGSAFKALLLCDCWELKRQSQYSSLICSLRLSAGSTSLTAIAVQTVSLKTIERVLNSHSFCLGTETELTQVTAVTLFLSLLLREAPQVNAALKCFSSDMSFEAMDCDIKENTIYKLSKQKKRVSDEEKATNAAPLRPTLFNRLSSSMQRYFLNNIAKYLQLCTQEVKVTLAILRRMRHVRNICKVKNAEQQNTDLLHATSPSTHSSVECIEELVIIAPDAPIIPDPKCPLVSALVTLRIPATASEEEFDIAAAALSALRCILSENRHGIAVKAMDEFDIFISFLNHSLQKGIDEVRGFAGHPDWTDLRSGVSCIAAETSSLRNSSDEISLMEIVDNGSELSDLEESNEDLYRNSRPRKRARRLRSRNSIVDEWLAEEDGDDIYADLENFLVP